MLQILFLGPSDLLEPKQSFAAMSKKLIVSPIVKTLVFSKEPERVSHKKTFLFCFLFCDSPFTLCSFIQNHEYT